MTRGALTMDEAAAELHKSRRWLQDWLRVNPADRYGVPFYSPLGRAKLFSDADIAAAIRADKTGSELERLNRLFNATFRIQREACEAAGRHIPLIVENVRGK